MLSLLVLTAVLTSSQGLLYGPCQHIPHPVKVDNDRWTHQGYITLHNTFAGARCEWVERYRIQDSGKTYLGDHFKHIESDKESESNWKGNLVGDVPGHYNFTTTIHAGGDTTFDSYYLHYDPPRITIHYACTNDPFYKNNPGGMVFVVTYSPDAVKEYACTIKSILRKNNLSEKNLAIIDNCNCPNIPYTNGPSKCQKQDVQAYFTGCP